MKVLQRWIEKKTHDKGITKIQNSNLKKKS